LIADGDEVSITDCAGNTNIFEFKDGTDAAAAGRIVLNPGGSTTIASRNGTQLATLLQTALDASSLKLSSTRSDNVLTLTQNAVGTIGNKTVSATVAGQANITGSNFSGGGGGAVPILRGVLMAASGVVPMLSGNFTNDSSAVSNTTLATAAGPKGSITGSVDLNNAEQTFVVLLNGHKKTSS
jgi:hypothetical protein